MPVTLEINPVYEDSVLPDEQVAAMSVRCTKLACQQSVERRSAHAASNRPPASFLHHTFTSLLTVG